MKQPGKRSITLLIISVFVFAACTSPHMKYEPGTIPDESKVAIFSWRGNSFVSSPVLSNSIANSVMGITKSKYQELNSIESQDLAEQDMFEEITNVLPVIPVIIQPSDYILNSKGKVDLEATGKNIGADVVLEMTTSETAREVSQNNNNFMTYWKAELKIEAKLWKVSDKETLWEKTCSAQSDEAFGRSAFADCSRLAVRCLINDLKNPPK